MKTLIKKFRDLYDRILEFSEHPKSPLFLSLLAMSEAIFFPVPVDPFIITMGAARPKKALHYALLASFFSVFGGCFGYWLGYSFWQHTSEFFFTHIFSQASFEWVRVQLVEHAFWAMFIAGFTVVPFKVFTITAGVAHMSFVPFILGSAFSRSLRFCVIGGLMYKYGPQARNWIEKHFEKFTLLCGILIVLVLVLIGVLKGHS